MRAWVRMKLIFLVVGSLLAGLLVPGAAAADDDAKIRELQQKIQQTQQELQRAEQQRANTQRRLNTIRSQGQALHQEITRLGNQIGDAEAELARLERELADAEERLQQATQELAAAEEELDYRRSLLRRRIQIIYEHGTVSYLEVLLTSTSFQDFLQRFHALRLIIGKDSDLFAEAEELWQLVQEKRAAVEAERQALAQRKAQVEARRREWTVMVADREEKRAQLQSDEAELRKALDELDRVSAEIERRLRSMQAELANYGGTVAGKFPLLPVDGRFRVSSNFGPRFHPILRTSRMHNGIDLAAPTGTPLQAVLPGIVTYAGTLGGYGNTIMIMHGTDEQGRQLVTLYAHASRIDVQAGQEVSAGQRIGAVGMTGLATGPHLHFEVRLNGTPVNPAPYLQL
ncbi:MAG TPA: peptidoglycan DD-metalloendopeptidase family protein [Sphingobacteriaceae bacterium]|nr:peptidoglycan DD-metalloendopeptidase family protein [Sphingobacteriaceae bacterium]